jgi:hypothetical protein
MRSWVVTDRSLFAGLAGQLNQEGRDVKMFCHTQAEKDVGTCFFEKVDRWDVFQSQS